jgi:predicted acylesterase/phospholipase RssA
MKCAERASYLLPIAKLKVEPDFSFVCAMPATNLAAVIPRLFRTYRVPKNQSFDCTIWEAARATTAAPTFFKGIHIGIPGLQERFIDGAIGRNNPIGQVFEEAELVFPDGRVACAISIGTGQAKMTSIPKPTMFQRFLPLDAVRAVTQIATHCERTAEETERRFKSFPNFYFRLNVEQGLQKVTLAQWDRLGEVATHTKQYLVKSEVDRKVDAAVEAIRDKRGVISTTQLST